MTVTGDYKPGRVVVEVTDFTVPIAGIPITIGRRYDSLEKDKVGDFGYGWSLTIGHPRLEVDPANYGVTLTLPDGRRATFDFAPATDEFAVQPVRRFLGPAYEAEPGVFGTLTPEAAARHGVQPGEPGQPVTCCSSALLALRARRPTRTPIRTERAYMMAATGELKSITDRKGNTLTFQPNGIISSTGKSVTFERDAQGRITKVAYPGLGFFAGPRSPSQYTYDAPAI